MSYKVESPSSSPTLETAHDAVRRGDRRRAHEISLELVAQDPASEQAWLLRASTADSLDESIAALSQALDRHPASPVARQALYEAMQRLLRRDAFLAYLGETSVFYYVSTAKKLRFEHPKDRPEPEPFPPPRTLPRTAFGWLGLALAGLPLAGLGALVCAPIAALDAFCVLLGRNGRPDRRRAWVILLCAAAVWLLALAFVGLLFLHLLP